MLCKSPRFTFLSALAIAATSTLAVAQTVPQPTVDSSLRVVPGDTQQRASTLIGMTVRNTAGENIGTVDDIVLNASEGKIQYAAISYGGILGLGDKLFAVPWEVLTCYQDANTGKIFIVFDVDENTLMNAPGFDQSNWPNFADVRWNDDVDKYYEKARRVNRTSADGVRR